MAWVQIGRAAPSSILHQEGRWQQQGGHTRLQALGPVAGTCGISGGGESTARAVAARRLENLLRCFQGSAMAWHGMLEKALKANKHLPYGKYFQIATLRASGAPACRTVVFRCAPAPPSGSHRQHVSRHIRLRIEMVNAPSQLQHSASSSTAADMRTCLMASRSQPPTSG